MHVALSYSNSQHTAPVADNNGACSNIVADRHVMLCLSETETGFLH